MDKKCVVIGSGFGGLTSGVILSKNGYDVTVLEQGSQYGGCLQCFRRRGVVFETGMHFIGSAGEGETMRGILRYLGCGDIPLSTLDRDGYNVVSLGGQRYSIPNGREAFLNRLSEQFPKEREGLRRYFDLVESVASASSLRGMTKSSASEAFDIRYQLTPIDTVLEELIGDERLRNVLVGDLSLYAARKGRTPFSTHAFIMDFYNRSSWRVAGGSDSIARALVAEIERNGGRVLTGAQVSEITVSGSEATGVVTSDGRRFDASLVISAIHPKSLLHLVSAPVLRPAWRQRIAAIPESVGCFTVYLHFKDGAMPYMNSNFFGYKGLSPWGCEDYEPSEWPMGYLYMHLCDTPGQQFARSGVIISYMRYDDVRQWEGTRVGRRGAEYEEFKRSHAERLLELVEREFPGLRESVAEYYTSTPLTYLDYTGTAEGSMYGVAHDVTLGPSCRVHHRTKISNLLLAGQNINSHGIMGVTVGSVVACGEVLGNEFLFNQIKEA